MNKNNNKKLYSKKNDFSDEDFLQGKNSVIECIKSGRNINRLYVLNGLKDDRISEVITHVKESNGVVDFVTKEFLDSKSMDKKHQGIIAFATAYKYYEVDDILNFAKEQNKKPFIIILDEIEDPHNVGAIIRTAYASGVSGIILKNRNACQVNQTVMKASAGAFNYMKIARVVNITNTIKYLKEKGLFIYCADMDGELIYKTDLRGSIAIVIGNEGKGVSKLVKDNCDFKIKIPMINDFESLNASVASSIIMYEVVRQNMF